MRKIVLLGFALTGSLFSETLDLRGVIFKEDSVLGKTHGGEKADIDVYEDGVGTIIKGMSGPVVNLKNYNSDVYKFGLEAKRLNVDLFTAGADSDASGKVKVDGGKITHFTYSGDEVISFSNHNTGYRFTDTCVDVDPSKRYKFSFDIIQGNEDGSNYNSDSITIVGFASFDADGKYIEPQMQADYSSHSRTELTRDYAADDLEVYLKDASGWPFHDGTELKAYKRDDGGTGWIGSEAQFVWYPYYDSHGNKYPDYEYSRNYRGHYGSGEGSYNGYQPGYKKLEQISENEWKMTLFRPLDQDLPAGTKIKATTGWGGFGYQLSWKKLPNGWIHKDYIVTGTTLNHSGAHFKKNLKCVKGLFRFNYANSTDNTTTLKNWRITELKN